MRVLIVDDFAKAAVQRVTDFATLPENWYRPGRDNLIPGDDPRFVAHIQQGYRCVFTITKAPDGFVFRHLSISVEVDSESNNKNLYPNVAAACALAELFGFSGWDGYTIDRIPDGWMVHINKQEHCIALGQAYEGAGRLEMQA